MVKNQYALSLYIIANPLKYYYQITFKNFRPNPAISDSDLLICETKDIYDYANFKMDKVRIYNRVLNATEIQKIYSKNTPISSGLLLRLDFDKYIR